MWDAGFGFLFISREKCSIRDWTIFFTGCYYYSIKNGPISN